MRQSEDKLMKELASTIGCCGLICALCYGCGPPTCDCHTAPKPEEANCFQRNCCIKKGLNGCWECEQFPCDKGYFGEASGGWRGLCVASVQYARAHGTEELVKLVMRKHGLKTEYSLYIGKTPEEVLRILKE